MCVSVCVETESHSVMSDSLQPHGLYSPWNSLGQNTGAGSLSLLQGIFPTQGLNSGLPHWGPILYQLSHHGSLKILEWVAYPFPRGSSWPRNWARVSCTVGGFFTNWAFREAVCVCVCVCVCVWWVYLFIWLPWVSVVACRFFTVAHSLVAARRRTQ